MAERKQDAKDRPRSVEQPRYRLPLSRQKDHLGQRDNFFRSQEVFRPLWGLQGNFGDELRGLAMRYTAALREEYHVREGELRPEFGAFSIYKKMRAIEEAL